MSNCGNDSIWQATSDAWRLDNTDTLFQDWLQALPKGHKSIPTELATQFGDHSTNYLCGIGSYSTCGTNGGCQSYYLNSDPAWSYLTLNAIVNLDTFFNNLYTGVTAGQTSYQGFVTLISDIYFPASVHKPHLGSVALWLIAIITALAGAFVLVDPELIGVVAAGTAAFIGAGISQAASVVPAISASPAGQFGADASNATLHIQQAITEWSSQTFSGLPDANQKTIADYLYNGSYAQGKVASSLDVSTYYSRFLAAKDIGVRYNRENVFIMFASTVEETDTTGPDLTKYYSKADGGVYYLYEYFPSKKGYYLDKPAGLDNLTLFGIQPSDVTESSARAWRQAGFNYTPEIAQNRLMTAVSSGGSLSPFSDGARWEGVFTVPVCDIGPYRQWNSQYGQDIAHSLPCCCGKNCADTKAFIKAANFNMTSGLLGVCEQQLKGSAIDYNAIDYGIKASKKKLSHKTKLAIGLGVGLGWLLVGTLLNLCLQS